MLGIKNKTYEQRYFTYYLTFPKGETWVRQKPFIHALEFELKNMRSQLGIGFEWKIRAHEILKKGETKWTDNNGVKHVVKVEDKERPEVWGIKRF